MILTAFSAQFLILLLGVFVELSFATCAEPAGRHAHVHSSTKHVCSSVGRRLRNVKAAAM